MLKHDLQILSLNMFTAPPPHQYTLHLSYDCFEDKDRVSFNSKTLAHSIMPGIIKLMVFRKQYNRAQVAWMEPVVKVAQSFLMVPESLMRPLVALPTPQASAGLGELLLHISQKQLVELALEQEGLE